MEASESLLPASSPSSPVDDEAQPSMAATAEDVNNDISMTSSSPPVTSPTPPSPPEPTPSASSKSTLSTAALSSDVQEAECGHADPLGCTSSEELDIVSSGKCMNGHIQTATSALSAAAEEETCLGAGREQEGREKEKKKTEKVEEEGEEEEEDGRMEEKGVNGEIEEARFLLTKMDRYDVQSAKKRSTSGGKDAESDTKSSSSGNGSGSAPGQKPEALDRPVRTCAVLCAAFFFVYTANLAIQNLQSSLHQGEGLGVTSLAVLYGSIIVFGSLSPLVIGVLGAKRTLVVAFVCHALYTASQFYPSFPTLLAASLLLGVLAGPMWTAQGLYCTAAGLAYAGVKQMEHHGALSLFNGIFFAFYEATQISGNLIASLVLTRDSYNSSHQHNKVCGAALCPGTSVNSTVIEQPESDIVYILLSIYLACNVVGIVLTALFLPPLPRAQEPQTGGSTLLKNTTSCLSMLLVPRMLLLLPFFMAQAMNSGILLAEYNQKFVSCSVGIQWVGYVMTAFGVLTSAQAVALNYAAKVLGRRVLFGAAAVADMAVNVAMLLWDPAGTSLPYLFILPAVSGFAEGIFQAQFNSLVAMVFPDHVTPAFATYHTSKATAFTLTFVLARFLCLYQRLYVSLTLASLGLLGYGVVEVMLHRQKKREAVGGISSSQ